MKIIFDFDWIYFNIKHELQMLKDFYDDIYKSLPTISKKIEDEIDLQYRDLFNQEEYDAIIPALVGEHYEKFESIYPNIITYAFITSLFSQVELHIKAICNDIKIKKKLPFAIEVFNGNLPEKIKLFLSAFGLPALDNEELKILHELNDIRNVIVHNGGSIENKEKMKNIILNIQSIKIVKDRIEIDYKYCDHIFAMVTNLFEKMFKSLGYKTELKYRKIEE
jgi:hypothetical protein